MSNSQSGGSVRDTFPFVTLATLGMAVGGVVVLIGAVWGVNWLYDHPDALDNPAVLVVLVAALILFPMALMALALIGHGMVDALGDYAAALGAMAGLDGKRKRAEEERYASESQLNRSKAKQAEATADELVWPETGASGGNGTWGGR